MMKKTIQLIIGGMFCVFAVPVAFKFLLADVFFPDFLVRTHILSGILFLFSGIAIILQRYPSKSSYYAQIAIAYSIIMIAAIPFVASIFGASLGDFFVPRTAYTTYIAFMAFGLFLILNKKETNKLIAVSIEGLIYIVGVIGIAGLISHFLKLDDLYSQFKVASMSLPVAIGLLIASFSLWIDLHESVFHQAWFKQEDDRISALGAVIMILIALISGITGFVTLQASIEESLRNSVNQILQGRIAFFKESVEQSVGRTQMIANRPILTKLLYDGKVMKDSFAYEILLKEVVSFQQDGFNGVAIYSTEGKEIFREGNYIFDPALRLQLVFPQRVEILWSNQFVLHTEIRMFHNKKFVGTVITEQFLPSLTSFVYDLRNMSESGGMLICGQGLDAIRCFPERLDSGPIVIPESGESFSPIKRALNGEVGVSRRDSSIWSNSVNAFSPITTIGLGAVLKVSTQELYKPISRELPNVIVLILFIVVIGTILLRSQIKPLATAIVTDAQRTKAIVDNVGDGIITLDQQGNIESVNPAGETIFGYPSNELVGQNIKVLLSSEAQTEEATFFEPDTLRSERAVNVEISAKKKGGKQIWTQWVLNKILFGIERGIIAVVRDVSLDRIAKQRLTWLATYDELTGVANRTLFNDRLAQAMARCIRHPTTRIALIYLDIDKFKEINDQYGHSVGDELLKKFAARLVAKVRSVDTVARLGGDEFAIILEDLKVDEHAIAVAEKIIHDAKDVFHLLRDNNKPLKVFVSTSVGIAYYGKGVRLDGEQLIERADMALYKAKTNGRNRFQVYES